MPCHPLYTTLTIPTLSHPIHPPAGPLPQPRPHPEHSLSLTSLSLTPPTPSQLARYLNLGHILVVVAADAQSKHFPVTRGLKYGIKGTAACLQRPSEAQQPSVETSPSDPGNPASGKVRETRKS